MLIISKFGKAITNFGIANPPPPVSTFSHATEYLTKLLTHGSPGCDVLPNVLSMVQMMPRLMATYGGATAYPCEPENTAFALSS
jgi:hypothetical protein